MPRTGGRRGDPSQILEDGGMTDPRVALPRLSLQPKPSYSNRTSWCTISGMLFPHHCRQPRCYELLQALPA